MLSQFRIVEQGNLIRSKSGQQMVVDEVVIKPDTATPVFDQDFIDKPRNTWNLSGFGDL